MKTLAVQKRTSTLENCKQIIEANGVGIVGTMHIKVVEGKLIRDTELILSMNPFVTIEYQGMEFKTKAAKSGGKNPLWDQVFEIQLYSLEDEIKISCFDEDLISNDYIGERTIKLKALCQDKLEERVIPLLYQKKKSADIIIQTKYYSTTPFNEEGDIPETPFNR